MAKVLQARRWNEMQNANGRQSGVESGRFKVKRETGRVPVSLREICQVFSSTKWAGNDRRHMWRRVAGIDYPGLLSVKTVNTIENLQAP